MRNSSCRVMVEVTRLGFEPRAGRLEDGLQSGGIDTGTMIADHEIDVLPVG